MGFIIWVLFGALVGWLASVLTRTKQGIVTNIVVGIFGSFIGGFVYTSLVGGDLEFGFNVLSFLTALGGSVVLLLIVKQFPQILSQTFKPSQKAPQAPYIKPNSGSKKISFISETSLREQTLIIGSEEVPLDNRFGSSVLVSEHEFSRRAIRTVKIERSHDMEIRFQAGVWSVLEAEASGRVAQTIGVDLQQEEFRRVTLRFEAASGKMVLYRVVWKQTQRIGEVQMQVDGDIVVLPYVATFGLWHSVESILQQVST